MPPEEPLAKSGERPVPLADHSCQVAHYAAAMAEAYRDHWRKILGEDWTERLCQALVTAALAHDLGKATEGFQRSLREPKFHWEFRHEVLSAALLLGAITDETLRDIAAATVLTHHRDLDDSQLQRDAARVPLPEPDIVQRAEQRFRQKARELSAYWGWLRAFWKGQDPLNRWNFPASPEALHPPVSWMERLEDEVGAGFLQDPKVTTYLFARGCLMAADHAVSAGVHRFRIHPPSPSLPPPRTFQQHVGDHLGDTILEVPTGSGKTFAALRWALKNRRSGERMFYLLPYQASIEAMADTLKEKFGKENVAVLHARTLEYAFREHFEGTGEYEMAVTKAREEVALNRLAHKPIKVTTPFQLLKWLLGIPRFEIGLSEMVGGLFIFDEIHAYDAHTVALITEMVRVLKKLGGRFLFMSATFPPFLKDLLKQAVGQKTEEFRLVGQKPLDEWTEGFLKQVRHILCWHDGTLEDLLPRVVEAAKNGKRVLVVANRVVQAQNIYRRLAGELEGTYLLHSRFTRRDRVLRERRILNALRGKSAERIQVLVATQVVEVSLDVSFDTIFTEVAPVDDLLQRFGRVNRYAEHPEGVEVHVARSFDGERLRWVYDLERLQRTLETAPTHRTPLTLEETTKWVYAVYKGGWTEREHRRFQQACKAFQEILKALRPLHHCWEGETEFYNLFKSVEILPMGLFDQYMEHFRRKEHLLAQSLLVPVRIGAFHRLQKEGRLSKHDLMGRGSVWVAEVPYDPDLGLLLEETTAKSLYFF